MAACVLVKGLTICNFFSTNFSCKKIAYFIICMIYSTNFSLSLIGVHAQFTSVLPVNKLP